MKSEEKSKAIKLRKQGLAMNLIAKQLGVAKSSVSLWVRHITLTAKQRFRLSVQSKQTLGFYAELGKKNAQRFRNIRMEYQDKGRKRLNAEKINLYLVGCILYWCEGTKSKNDVAFTNSDPDMVRLFMEFLRKCLKVKDDNITLCVHAHLSNGISREDIEGYWLDITALPKTSLRKGAYDRYSKASTRRKKNLIYGTARINVCNTSLLHCIYGSIARCCGLKYKWLDGPLAQR